MAPAAWSLSNRSAATLLVAAAIAPFVPALGSAFLGDTYPVLVNAWDAFATGPWSFLRGDDSGGFRPLTVASIAGTAWFAEAAELPHRAINLILHAGATLVVWRVAARLGCGRSAAMAAALLFCWSPCLAFLPPWIAGRSDLLAGLAAGLVFLAFRRDRERPTGGSLAALWAACLLLACSKEVGILVPAAIAVAGGRQWRRYLPLITITLALAVFRVWFHLNVYDPATQREYGPMELLRDPARAWGALVGLGRQGMALGTCAFGPWQLREAWLRPVATGLGLLWWLAIVLVTRRHQPLGLLIATALLIPVLPFLHRSMGYYMYAPAVFLLPMWTAALMRLRAGVVLLGALLVVALVGCVHHVVLWVQAGERFDSAVARLSGARQRVAEEWAATAEPVLVEVIGLPEWHGPLPLFPQLYAPSNLQAEFFDFPRTRDRSAEGWRRFREVFWWAGELDERAQVWIHRGYRVETVRLEAGRR